jgi:pimeloyl-ACP methyl ester carboxylesterase
MGDPSDPAVLLIMGLGAQLVFWRTGFCERLVNQGLRVIRYDNRDVGLSSKVEGGHTGAKLLPRMARSQLGLRSPAVYTLENMADDAAALLDHLQIESAPRRSPSCSRATTRPCFPHPAPSSFGP